MTRLSWGNPGERLFETGVDRGVLYAGGPGVPWNGITAINEQPSGGEVEAAHFDGIKYADFVSNEDYQANLEAFSAPPEFSVCEGNRQLAVGLFATQQVRSLFGLSYRTLIGNDLKADELGYKLHLVYNCTASPGARSNKTSGESVSPLVLQWKIDSVPPPATTYKPTAHFIVDSTKVAAAKLTALENLLYGTSSTAPSLPTQAAVIALLS